MYTSRGGEQNNDHRHPTSRSKKLNLNPISCEPFRCQPVPWLCNRACLLNLGVSIYIASPESQKPLCPPSPLAVLLPRAISSACVNLRKIHPKVTSFAGEAVSGSLAFSDRSLVRFCLSLFRTIYRSKKEIFLFLIVRGSMAAAKRPFLNCRWRVPKGVRKRLDFYRSRFFWQSDGHKKKYSLAKWEMICRPKEQGGLGIEVLEIGRASCRERV